MTPSGAAGQSLRASVYTGAGTGTNLGGLVGLGVEIRVGPYWSVSAASGTWPQAMQEGDLDESPVDFDAGVKLYPFRRWAFAGLNYGLIDAAIVESDVPGTRMLRKTHGFTISAGVRSPSLHRMHVSALVGITSRASANYLTVFDSRSFVPHVSLMIGYALHGAD